VECVANLWKKMGFVATLVLKPIWD